MDPTGLPGPEQMSKGQREACLGFGGSSETEFEERGLHGRKGNRVSLCHFPGLSCFSPRVMPTLASQTVAAPQGEAPDHQAEESQEDRFAGQEEILGLPWLEAD